MVKVHITGAYSVWLTNTAIGSFRKSGIWKDEGFIYWKTEEPEGRGVGGIPEELLW